MSAKLSSYYKHTRTAQHASFYWLFSLARIRTNLTRSLSFFLLLSITYQVSLSLSLLAHYPRDTISLLNAIYRRVNTLLLALAAGRPFFANHLLGALFYPVFIKPKSPLMNALYPLL